VSGKRKVPKLPKRLFKRTQETLDYWPEVTKRRRFRYFFHPKHHGAGDPTDSRWKPDVTKSEEFNIFNIADDLDLADEDGNLYNVRKAADGTILELGVFHEQLARFWKPRAAADAWHGHPLWPVGADGPSNRGKQSCRPGRSVFHRLVEQGVLSERDSNRLNNGRII
jgi:hypothetical protein